jgi:hypothetical protein
MSEIEKEPMVQVKKAELDALIEQLQAAKAERAMFMADVAKIKSVLTEVIILVGIEKDKKPNAAKMMMLVPKVMQNMPKLEQIFNEDIKPLLSKYGTD